MNIDILLVYLFFSVYLAIVEWNLNILHSVKTLKLLTGEVNNIYLSATSQGVGQLKQQVNIEFLKFVLEVGKKGKDLWDFDREQTKSGPRKEKKRSPSQGHGCQRLTEGGIKANPSGLIPQGSYKNTKHQNWPKKQWNLRQPEFSLSRC